MHRLGGHESNSKSNAMSKSRIPRDTTGGEMGHHGMRHGRQRETTGGETGDHGKARETQRQTTRHNGRPRELTEATGDEEPTDLLMYVCTCLLLYLCITFTICVLVYFFTSVYVCTYQRLFCLLRLYACTRLLFTS